MSTRPDAESRERENAAAAKIADIKRRLAIATSKPVDRILGDDDAYLRTQERAAVAKLKKEEEEAYADYEILLSVVENAARRLKTVGSEAEEIASEGLAHVWVKVDQYSEDKGDFRNWVARVLKNEQISKMRSAGNQRKLLSESSGEPVGAGKPEFRQLRSIDDTLEDRDLEGWPTGQLQRSLLLFVAGLDHLATPEQRGYDDHWPRTTPWMRDSHSSAQRQAAYFLDYVEMRLIDEVQSFNLEGGAAKGGDEIFDEVAKRTRSNVPKIIRRHYWRTLLTQPGWSRTLRFIPTTDDEPDLRKFVRSDGAIEQHVGTLATPLWMLHRTVAAARELLSKMSVKNLSTNAGSDFVYAAWLDEESARFRAIAKLLDLSPDDIEFAYQAWLDSHPDREQALLFRQMFLDRTDLPYARSSISELEIPTSVEPQGANDLE